MLLSSTEQPTESGQQVGLSDSVNGEPSQDGLMAESFNFLNELQQWAPLSMASR